MPGLALALVGALWAVLASAALGADLGGAQPAALDPYEVTGRDFAGRRWPEAAREGRLEFTASIATVWTVSTGGQTVTRMLLERDVIARVGVYEFTAARAVVWVQQVGGEGAATDYQFYIYFDRLTMPSAAPNAQSAVTLSGDRVPVLGVLRTPGGVILRADKVDAGPIDDPLVKEGERSLASYLRSSAGTPQETEDRPSTRGAAPGEDRPYSADAALAAGAARAALESGFPPAVQGEAIFAQEGVISLAFGSGRPGSALRATEEENDAVVEFDSGIVIQYRDRNTDRAVQLTAERGVVFLKPGLIRGLAEGRTSFDVSDVRGFYLEGDVVANATQRDARGLESNYAVRAPRAYYDVQNDRALLLDAVFWTYDQQIGLPLYMRAKTIRQESATQFSAGPAQITNTGFVRPFLAIGVESVTISRRDPAPTAPPGERSRWMADAKHLTARLGGVPMLWWPRYVGEPARFPLRGFGFGDSFGTGAAVTTEWDILNLAGIDGPPGASANLLLDYYFNRGVGIGTQMALEREEMDGDFLAYVLPYDTGTDQLSTGARIDHDGDTRGVVVGEFQKRIDEHWTLQLEGSYLSDPTVVDTFFREDARTRREYANSAYLARTDDDSALTLQVKGSFNDFTPNQYLLQDQGYTVDRLPEATYTRLNDDLLPSGAPGLLAYSSEYRVGMLGLNFTEPLASEMGFSAPGRSRAALGVEPDESVGDRLRAEGYTESNVFRFDTRQEITSQLRAGAVNIVPFVAGRLTAYDRDFSEFNPDNDDEVRLWGSVGTRLATEIQRVDNSVENRFFDLHRLRHIIEPGATVWFAGTNIDQADLPVYDDEVESIADGGAIMIGAHQTWQTQRGGPGRYRSVDFLTLNTDFQFSTEDSEPESPIGRWFDYRPEYSNMGDFFTVDSTWQATEVLALSGRSVYDLAESRQAITSAGIIIQHTPEFRTGAEVLYLDVEDSTFLDFGVGYDLSDKHSMSGILVYDTEVGKVQQVAAEVLRRFPNVVFGFSIGFNDISDEVSFGFTLYPVGLEQGGARFRGLGSPNERAQSSSIGQ
jgi:hypothetical protein